MRKILTSVFLLFVSTGIFAASMSCDNPRNSGEVAECLGVELRDTDQQINAIYKELIAKRDESGKQMLRNEQRVWLKQRDLECNLDTKESNREKWMQNILRDFRKTTCTVGFTRTRIAALKRLQSNSSSTAAPILNQPAAAIPPATPVAPGEVVAVPSTKRPPTVHSQGKWYFEVTVNYGAVLKIEPTVLAMGVTDDRRSMSGIMENIRPKDSAKPVRRIGVATDLDNGKIYVSYNGEWDDAAPGSNKGLDVKLGRNYYATVYSSAGIEPYLQSGAIMSNFGDTSFVYAMPAGYSPWRDK